MKTFSRGNLKLFLIPLVTSIIIFSWFYEGKLISNGSEEDLNIYHSQKSAEYYSTFWYPVGTGFKTPFHFERYPTFSVLGILEQNYVPGFFRQALLLWFLMVVGISATYLLLRIVLGISKTSSLIGSFFYLLNIFSMTQVWKRFLYHGIFAWAYLPLFLFLWIKWIDSKKIGWLFLFLLTSLFFSYTFSQPAFLITIWAPAGIYVLVRVWQSRSKPNEIITTFLRSVAGLAFWCLVNIWWLYPLLTLGSTWTAQSGVTWEADFSSLQAVSKYFPIWEVLLLRQSWYLGPENDWSGFYHNPFVILINISVLFFVVLGIVKNRSHKYWIFLAIVAFVGLFINKGTNFPFGYTFFKVLFSKFPLTTAFRNSYEKFGLVLLLPYTIFFTFGFGYFLKSLKQSKRYLIGGVILFLSCGLLVYPIWTGDIFPRKHRIVIPQYYVEANNYLKGKSNDRVFHIPFLIELDRIHYSWGYIGQDPSQNLLDQESITTPKTPLYYQLAQLMPKFLEDKQFTKVLGLLGVGNIILHKDILSPKINIEETTKRIENWNGIEDKREFGELVIYSLDKGLINSRIYAAGTVVSVSSIEEGINKVISNQFDTKTTVFMLDDQIPLLTQNLPKVNFKKVSNDLYKIDVNQATGPFILVLNNTFDKLWQAKIDNQIVNKHFIVNGFANGWLIERTGNFRLEIRLKVWPWQ